MDRTIEKRKNIYLNIGIISFLLGVLSKLIYRSYIKSHNIYDFGLSDSFPSYIYVIGIIFVILSLTKYKDKKKTYSTIITVTLGASIYEIEQIFTSMIFDFKDIIATILGTVTSIVLVNIIEKFLMIKNDKVTG